MEIGHTERTVVSKSKRRRHGKDTQEVIIKTAAYRVKGKMKFISTTRHELV